MDTSNSAFDLSRTVVKFSSVALLNYVSLFLVQLSETWPIQPNATAFVDISAGVAFVTILLLGAFGAAATLVALMLQYFQLDGSGWFAFTTHAFAGVLLQYVVICACLKLLGLGRALQGLTHFQLMILSAVFSTTYTVTDVFILQQLHTFHFRPIAQYAVGDFFGIITCFLFLKLVVLVRRRLTGAQV